MAWIRLFSTCLSSFPSSSPFPGFSRRSITFVSGDVGEYGEGSKGFSGKSGTEYKGPLYACTGLCTAYTSSPLPVAENVLEGKWENKTGKRISRCLRQKGRLA